MSRKKVVATEIQLFGIQLRGEVLGRMAANGELLAFEKFILEMTSENYWKKRGISRKESEPNRSSSLSHGSFSSFLTHLKRFPRLY